MKEVANCGGSSAGEANAWLNRIDMENGATE